MADNLNSDTQRVPSQTIYINNINEKIRKDELRKCLYALCTQFGPILDIVALKTLKMRGQAFVVFKDVGAASSALHTLSGFSFFDKPLRVQYAESKSDIVARIDGSYSVEEKARQKKAKAEAKSINKKKRKATEMPEGEPAAKRANLEATADLNPPNKILFVQHVSEGTTTSMLSELFSKFTGFKEVKMPKAGLAFVFYENEVYASQALTEYQGWKFNPSDRGLSINYAKH